MFCVATIVALGVGHWFAEPASARGDVKPRNNNAGGSNSVTRGSVATSSSISFKKDGKLVTITENGSGTTVTMDGDSVRARNVDDLKKQYPDAYRLYVEKPGFAIGSAGASGSQSSSSTKGAHPGNVGSKSSHSRDRSVTAIDNGEKVTITESASGITVTVGEKSVRARTANEQKKKSAKAFRLYEEYLNKPDAHREVPDADSLPRGDFGDMPNAADGLRQKLEELKAERPDHPRFQELIQRMLRENGN
jgi:hypothetical protein